MVSHPSCILHYPELFEFKFIKNMVDNLEGVMKINSILIFVDEILFEVFSVFVISLPLLGNFLFNENLAHVFPASGLLNLSLSPLLFLLSLLSDVHLFGFLLHSDPKFNRQYRFYFL